MLRTITAVTALFVSGFVSAQTINRQAKLTWTAPSACATGVALSNCPITGYSIERRDNNVWTEIGTTLAAILTYTDSNLSPGIYTYRVLAISDNGSSAPSNEVSKSIDVPGAPGNLVITITVTVTP